MPALNRMGKEEAKWEWETVRGRSKERKWIGMELKVVRT